MNVKIINGKACIYDSIGLTSEQYKLLKKRNPTNNYYKIKDIIYKIIEGE